MEPHTLQHMAQAAKGELMSGSGENLAQRVCTDSREARAGDLFVALRGERFDGHDFLEEVAQRKVAGVVVERGRVTFPLPCPVIVVDDTRAALGRIAAEYRRGFNLPLIAVAGSNGKTTTKDILASVLRQKFNTLASKASFNNDIGVPTTLLELKPEHEVAVLEFGTNHPGELAPLLKMARPAIGVLTSIGREHLEFFGDLAGVLDEEGSLAELLPDNGQLFLNADTPGASEIVRRSKAAVVKVGLGNGYDWRATQIQVSENGLRFQVESDRAEFNREFRVPLLGRHQVVNTLLAVAVAAELGLTPDEIQQGLLTCSPVKMRLQIWQFNGIRVLDDSYNANADSVRAALETLRDLPCAGRRVAVLGDMAELGDHAAGAHAEVGSYAASMGTDYLVAVGKMASITARCAREAGLKRVEEFADVAEAGEALRQELRPNDLVLLKASRATALERIGALIRGNSGAPCSNERQ